MSSMERRSRSEVVSAESLAKAARAAGFAMVPTEDLNSDDKSSRSMNTNPWYTRDVHLVPEAQRRRVHVSSHRNALATAWFRDWFGGFGRGAPA
jgi:hypothetical protein